MSGQTTTTRRKQLLFVDDDASFLAGLRDLFAEMSKGSWEMFTAESHAQALTLMQKQRMDLVVLDVGMPVMDGLQFLRLLGRTHPGQPVVMLTGRTNPDTRKACLENGAGLVLEKPITPEGFSAVYAALDALAEVQPNSGFRGMMRRVGLPEVLQIECLGRKSSVLEISTGRVRGRIYISEGSIIHAESGALQGEAALYGLLALQGGDFNLLIFSEPPHRTISGHWESLLMEAARLSDEGADLLKQGAPEGSVAEAPANATATSAATVESPAPHAAVSIEETLLCSGAGEVLYHWQCESVDARKRLLDQIEHQAAEISALGAVGRFDRLEILSPDGRLVCQVNSQMRLLLRSVSSEVSL